MNEGSYADDEKLHGRMAVTVTLDGPPRQMVGLAWRGLAVALGAICVIVGWLVATTGFVVFLGLFIAWVFAPVWAGAAAQEGHPADFSGLWSFTQKDLWAMGIGLVVLYLGLFLVRRWRRLVLFLRRFGNSEATRAVTAATGVVGRSWRLVTLDDARIAPVGVGAGSRTFMSVAQVFGATYAKAVVVVRVAGKSLKFVAISAVCGAVGAVALTAVRADGDFRHRFLTVMSLLNFKHPIGGTPAELFRICAFVAAGCWAVPLASALLALPIFVAGTPFYVGVVNVRSAISNAEQAKTGVIADVSGIVHARRAARQISRRVISPNLAVMRVDSEVWRLAVGGLAAVCAVPLVDVSQPSENVLWEIAQMRHWFGPRCVFVGDYDRVSQLTRPTAAGTMLARQQELLDGCQVLAYTNDEPGLKAFTLALRATFEMAVRLSLPATRPPDPITRQMTRQALREFRRDVRAENRAARWSSRS